MSITVTGSALPARTLHFSIGVSGRYIYLVGQKTEGCKHGVIHVFDLWAGTNNYYRIREEQMHIWPESNIRHLYEFASGQALAITEKQGLELMVYRLSINHKQKTLSKHNMLLVLKRNGSTDAWSSTRNDKGITIMINSSRYIQISQIGIDGKISNTVITERLELWGQPWQEKETLFCFETIRLDGRRRYTGRVVAINLATKVVTIFNHCNFPFDPSLNADWESNPLIRIKHVCRNGLIWVISERTRQVDKEVSVWRIENDRWFHLLDVPTPFFNITLDIQEDNAAVILEKEHCRWKQQHLVKAITLVRVGSVPTLKSIAQINALHYNKKLRENEHISKIMLFK